MDEKEKALLKMLVEGMLLLHAEREIPERYAHELFDFALRIGVLDPDQIGPPSEVNKMPKFRVERVDRASLTGALLHVGQHVYPGRDFYGCAAEDSFRFNKPYVAVSLNESGEPFFTIPREDIEPLSPLPSEPT